MGIFDRLFKKAKVLPPYDLSQLGIDLHSHLLPGIDDGSDSIETSLQLIKKFIELGYKKAITSPHVMSDYYPNTSIIINEKLELVRAEISKLGWEFELDAVAEYFLEDNFESLIEKNDVLTFGDNYVLFELPMFMEPASFNDVVFKMQLEGYKPVLAHPERYTYWGDSFEKLEEIYDKDVLFQVNINSLSGAYSPQVQKIAEKLIDKDMVSFIGSDCHNNHHLQLLQESIKTEHFHKLMQSKKLLNRTL